MSGWTGETGGKQRKHTHRSINGGQGRGVEEEWSRKEGQKGGSNGVFVLVGVTHKAFSRAAQLSYRYQTQRIRREECVCE